MNFSNAKAVCHDGSAEMLALGRKRLAKLKGRVKFVQCDLSKTGWSKKIKGPFDAVVSSIAIHNVREHDIIRSIYAETFFVSEAWRLLLESRSHDTLGS